MFPKTSILTGKKAEEPKLSINDNRSEQQFKKKSVGISLFSVNFKSINLLNQKTLLSDCMGLN